MELGLLRALKTLKNHPYVQYVGLGFAGLLKAGAQDNTGAEPQPRKTKMQLIRISAAVCGIELCYAAETAFVSPILLKLGVPVSLMTMIWCVSPVLGFFLVPFMGSLSDRCNMALGRRRPFILVMSVGIVLGLALVPNGEALGLWMGDNGTAALHHPKYYAPLNLSANQNDGNTRKSMTNRPQFETAAEIGQTQNSERYQRRLRHETVLNLMYFEKGINGIPHREKQAYRGPAKKGLGKPRPIRHFHDDDDTGNDVIHGRERRLRLRTRERRNSHTKADIYRGAQPRGLNVKNAYNANITFNREYVEDEEVEDGEDNQQDGDDEERQGTKKRGGALTEDHFRGIILTIVGVALLDFNCDACQSPCRAYLLDVSLPEDHPSGLTMFTVMAGLGGTVGYVMGGIDWNATSFGEAFGGHIRVVFTLVVVVFIACVATTVASFRETPLSELGLDVTQLQGKKKKVGKSKYRKFSNADSSDDNDDDSDGARGEGRAIDKSVNDHPMYGAVKHFEDTRLAEREGGGGGGMDPFSTPAGDSGVQRGYPADDTLNFYQGVSSTGGGYGPAYPQSFQTNGVRSHTTDPPQADRERIANGLRNLNENEQAYRNFFADSNNPGLLPNHGDDDNNYKDDRGLVGANYANNDTNFANFGDNNSSNNSGTSSSGGNNSRNFDNRNPPNSVFNNHHHHHKNTDGRGSIITNNVKKLNHGPTDLTSLDVQPPSPIEISTDVTLKTYLHSIIHMPRCLWVLCLVNLFCWMSLVCYSLYFTDFVGQAVFSGDPRAPPGSVEHNAYDDGVRLGSFGMSLYSLSCSIYSLLIEKLVRRYRAKRVYVVGQLVFTVGMAIMAASRHKWAVILLSPTAGIMYATLFTMPYLLVAHYHTSGLFLHGSLTNPRQVRGLGTEVAIVSSMFLHGSLANPRQVRGLGTDVAIVSSMVFLAQFLLSVAMGTIIYAVSSTTTVIIASSVLSSLGALTATQITYLDL